MRVLIIGGYGTFGRRIAERLSNVGGLELILAGRSLAKAEAACTALSGAANFMPLRLDRTEPLTAQIATPPDLLIDASGPFQNYDPADSNLPVRYALSVGCDYADLSDDGQFCAAMMALDTEAKAAGIAVMTGLSTCSVLSAIGLREIAAQIGPVEDVTIGIAPSPKADLGRNVVGAIARYAGQETVAVVKAGTRQMQHGLLDGRKATICVPGDVPLPRLLFSLADAPDAWLLPQDFPELQNIWIGAGTRPQWLHRSLVGLSHIVARTGLNLSPLTGLFHRARGWVRFGQHRGGMIVRGANTSGAASWHLVAEGDHGPMIPALPTVALIRKYLAGAQPEPGAYAGHTVVALPDLKPEFARLEIAYGLQFDGGTLPVYEHVMGDGYAALLPAIQALHRTGDGRRFAGRCKITRGRNPLSWLVAEVFRFPKAGEEISVELDIIPTETGELWRRNFAGRVMQSHHTVGTGRWARHVTETFGPIRIHMAILEEAGRLRIKTRGWSIFGLPLPHVLCPGGDVYETQDAHGRFHFHVDLRAPGFGRLCKYEGWLEDAAR